MTETTGTGLARGGRRTLIVVGLTVILLVLGAMVAWRVVAAGARDKVAVTWSGSVECTGTTVEQARPDGEPIPAIRLREGMSCTLPVRVTNDSRFTVTVMRVRLPYLGPEAGPAVQVTQLDGTPVARPNAVDAVFRLRERLEPGAAYDFDVDFEFRPPPEGCTDEGLFKMDEFPQVRVLALGRPGVRKAQESIGFLGSRDSDCSS
jgi:hypothetical protein